jgi:hypothetical protein
MKPVLMSVGLMVLLLAVGLAHADLPTTTLHVVTAPRTDLVVHPGDLIQLEHTYLLIQSPPKDAIGISSDKCVTMVTSLRVQNTKVLGSERATVAGLFRAEVPGRSTLTFEIVEKNGKRKTITCHVDVR